jgi:Protein of unknown function (DUF2971)
MNDQEIGELFEPLWADAQGPDSFPSNRPLLAHYTSVAVLEAILRNKELWFSNPLFMNDLEEVRFGMTVGANLFLGSPEIEPACGSKQRFDTLRSAFNNLNNAFANEHVLDLYVFCLSQHAKEDNDGLLSMWRGYGGNGSGAAIVLDTAKITAREDLPLVVAKVHYGTAEQRMDRLKRYITQFAGILQTSRLPDDKLWLASFYFFQRLKQFSIFTKHRGFLEEDEWRIVYLKDRDGANSFDKMLSYTVGPRGVEPRLKLKIDAIPGTPEMNISLAEVVDRIILGPSVSSPLAHAAIVRMVERLNFSELRNRIFSSTIPFRAT